MKNIILITICIILFSSCQKSKSDTVKDFVFATNSYDTEKMSQLLSEDFLYYGTDTLNKTEYLKIDSLICYEVKITLLK